MTAKKSTTKRKFNITIMRPIFQVAVLEIEAATRDEAIELAQERELTLKNEEWNGPWERALYDETENGLEVFRGAAKAKPTEQ